MGAPLTTASAVRRSGARTCNGGGNDGKPPKGPKKPASPKCLLSEADIAAAVNWSLDGILAGDLEPLADVLRPLAGDFREDRPEVAEVLADISFPGAGLKSWTIACAVLARDAAGRGDVAGFWAAGMEVVAALRQSDRGKLAGNPLTPIMREFKANHPGLTADQAFAHFVGIADACAGTHELIAGYSSCDDALLLRGADAYSSESFCRQYRRI